MKEQRGPTQAELREKMRRGYLKTIETYGADTARRMLYGRISDAEWEELLAEAGVVAPAFTPPRTPTPPPAGPDGMVSVKGMFAAMFPEERAPARQTTEAESQEYRETLAAIRRGLKMQAVENERLRREGR
jgi:hypothetical protein